MLGTASQLVRTEVDLMDEAFDFAALRASLSNTNIHNEQGTHSVPVKPPVAAAPSEPSAEFAEDCFVPTHAQSGRSSSKYLK